MWGNTLPGSTPALSHRAFISRQMLERSRGLPVRVVNTAPAVFFCARIYFCNSRRSLYSATKGAVTAFTRSLALELAVDNVRANVVCPGDVATPLLEKQLQTYGGSINEMKNWYPLMRIADAEEIGQVIAFLISEKSSYMTGAVIPVDGGLTDW